MLPLSSLHSTPPAFLPTISPSQPYRIQGGDYENGDGTGGRSVFTRRRFCDEGFVLKHDAAGVVACANSGPNSNTSQFYILLGPADWLDGTCAPGRERRAAWRGWAFCCARMQRNAQRAGVWCDRIGARHTVLTSRGVCSLRLVRGRLLFCGPLVLARLVPWCSTNTVAPPCATPRRPPRGLWSRNGGDGRHQGLGAVRHRGGGGRHHAH